MSFREVTCLGTGFVLAALACPTGVSAEQFVLLDLTYEATTENTMDSHYEVPPAMGIPANWESPVAYANGTAHIRFEVMTKPSDVPTLLNVCFANASNYACMPYPPPYMNTGVYEFAAPFAAFWQGDLVDWAMGVNKVMLILKNQTEMKVQGDSMFYPYKMRATITIVSSGSTYMPPVVGMPPTEPMAGAGGAGGAGGRGGPGGAAARGGTGGTGGARAGSAAGSGGAGPRAGGESQAFDASIPPGSEVPDASGDDWDLFDDDETGTLPPQPSSATSDKRAPPDGGLRGSACALISPGRERRARGISFAGLAVVAGAFALSRALSRHDRRRARGN